MSEEITKGELLAGLQKIADGDFEDATEAVAIARETLNKDPIEHIVHEMRMVWLTDSRVLGGTAPPAGVFRRMARAAYDVMEKR